jgi:hypothetical protein
MDRIGVWLAIIGLGVAVLVWRSSGVVPDPRLYSMTP